MDATTCFDALANVHDVAANPGLFVFMVHRGGALWEQDLSRRQRYEVHRETILRFPFIVDFEEPEAAAAEGVDYFERRSPRPDHCQIAIDNGQQPVEVHRSVREANSNHLCDADLPQHPFDLVGAFLVGAQPFGEKAELLIHPDDVRALEGC